LQEKLFGELNEKQAEYTDDILTSGRHLLSLINEILDLSKVEAGRMELELATFDLPLAIENARTFVRERATRHGITLDVAVDDRLGEFVGDERKIKQILLNLLSNATKFTPEGGRIGIKARQTDGSVEISVTDTGIGIRPGGPAKDLRGVSPGRLRLRVQGRGNRSWANLGQEIRRAAWGEDLGGE
jgi:signal transduction histidine kinase